MLASTASAPEFQKKNVSSFGSGMMVSSSLISSSMGWLKPMFSCACVILPHCSCAARVTRGWQ